jgi:hypothetical protein
MSYETEILADSPVGYWRLGEASGTTAADASGNGYTGTYLPNSGGAWTGGTQGTTGVRSGEPFATSVQFSAASTGRVNPAGLLFNSGVATVETWINLQPGAYNDILGFVNGHQSGVYDKRFYLGGDGTLAWYAWDGMGKSVFGPIINTNEPHHIVGVADGTNLILYVDGAEYGRTACGPTYTGYTVPNFFIGSGTTTASSTRQQDVAIYNTGLSAARILAHYNAGITAAASGAPWVYAHLLNNVGGL